MNGSWPAVVSVANAFHAVVPGRLTWTSNTKPVGAEPVAHRIANAVVVNPDDGLASAPTFSTPVIDGWIEHAKGY